MNNKDQWRFFYAMVASWNYHPRAIKLNPVQIGFHADDLLADLLQEQEKRKWPDGQQSDK